MRFAAHGHLGPPTRSRAASRPGRPAGLHDAADQRLSLRSDQIEAGAAAHGGALDQCYDHVRLHPGHANKDGTAVVAFDIDGNGDVHHAELDGSDVRDVVTERCLVATVASWEFPATGADARVEYPFSAIPSAS
ncbi:MAG: AgmX/PglI C-terminal domain-containing protein [Nannocystaceae bacterium]